MQLDVVADIIDRLKCGLAQGAAETLDCVLGAVSEEFFAIDENLFALGARIRSVLRRFVGRSHVSIKVMRKHEAFCAFRARERPGASVFTREMPLKARGAWESHLTVQARVRLVEGVVNDFVSLETLLEGEAFFAKFAPEWSVLHVRRQMFLQIGLVEINSLAFGARMAGNLWIGVDLFMPVQKR